MPFLSPGARGGKHDTERFALSLAPCFQQNQAWATVIGCGFLEFGTASPRVPDSLLLLCLMLFYAPPRFSPPGAGQAAGNPALAGADRALSMVLPARRLRRPGAPGARVSPPHREASSQRCRACPGRALGEQKGLAP